MNRKKGENNVEGNWEIQWKNIIWDIITGKRYLAKSIILNGVRISTGVDNILG